MLNLNINGFTAGAEKDAFLLRGGRAKSVVAGEDLGVIRAGVQDSSQTPQSLSVRDGLDGVGNVPLE